MRYIQTFNRFFFTADTFTLFTLLIAGNAQINQSITLTMTPFKCQAISVSQHAQCQSPRMPCNDKKRNKSKCTRCICHNNVLMTKMETTTLWLSSFFSISDKHAKHVHAALHTLKSTEHCSAVDVRYNCIVHYNLIIGCYSMSLLALWVTLSPRSRRV